MALVVVFSSTTLGEAEIVAGLLQSHAIDAVIMDRMIANTAPHYLHSGSGIRVAVPDTQLYRAKEILSQSTSIEEE